MNSARKKDKHPDNVITLDIADKRRTRRLKFASEEDRIGWEKAYRKSKLFIPYFLVGIAINFILYLSGLDLSGNLLLGGLVGMIVPMATMFLLSELHYRIFHENTVAKDRLPKPNKKSGSRKKDEGRI